MLRRTLSASLAVLLLAPALLRADDAPKGDKDLEGAWQETVTVLDGKELKTPSEEKGELIIQGDMATVKYPDRTDSDKFKIDATKTPKAIDITVIEGSGKGTTSLGVYEVKGDELRICVAMPGKDRPAAVASKEGSGLTLVTLKRVKK
jgi:uncharacterized protein (TIGR03067 family)